MFFFARELLFSFDNYFVSRESIQSLSGSEIKNVILDIWALRLNNCDLKISIGQPKRVFFSTNIFVSKFSFYVH